MIISYNEILEQQMKTHEEACLFQVFDRHQHSQVLHDLWIALCEKHQYQVEQVKGEYLDILKIIKAYVEENVHVH